MTIMPNDCLPNGVTYPDLGKLSMNHTKNYLGLHSFHDIFPFIYRYKFQDFLQGQETSSEIHAGAHQVFFKEFQ